MICSSRIISKMQPEIHTMEKFDFLKSIVHSQIIFNSQLFMNRFLQTGCVSDFIATIRTNALLTLYISMLAAISERKLTLILDSNSSKYP